MARSPDQRAHRMAELAEALTLPLPAGIRDQFEQELADLRAQELLAPAAPPAPPAVTGAVELRGGTVRGTTIGLNTGTVQVFFGGVLQLVGQPEVLAGTILAQAPA